MCNSTKSFLKESENEENAENADGELSVWFVKFNFFFRIEYLIIFPVYNSLIFNLGYSKKGVK